MRRIPCVNGFTWIASMPSAVSPDYFVAKKGAGQAKGRAVWIDGRGVKKTSPLKKNGGEMR